MENLEPVPGVGELFYFYSNDQIKVKTEHKAKILKVHPFQACQNVTVPIYESLIEDVIEYSIIDYWVDAIDELFWILSPTTDYILEINVPTLSAYNIFVARTLDGGWHSFEVHGSFEFGILDVTGDKYNELHDDLPKN